MSLTNKVLTVRAKAPVAAGQTAQTSSWIDTAGYEGIRFIVGMGSITSGAATSAKVQQSTDSGGSGAADLEGTSITIADTGDNKLYILEVVRPRERYLACVVSRATQDSVIDLIIAELYGPKKLPVTQDATVGSAEVAASPAEGTA